MKETGDTMFCVPIYSYILFLCFILLTPQVITHAEARCHVDDEAGLLAFKSGITADPKGILSEWIAGTDCCRWPGVVCWTERVGMLSLDGQASTGTSMLSGTISPALSKLQELGFLVLDTIGNLTGPLPESLCDLPNLESIYITNTKLSGHIPDKIGQMPALFSLFLVNNQLSGKIPSSIGKTQLGWVNLSGNRLQGTIPPEMGKLKTLYSLDLSGNRLSGPIPDVFYNFPSLLYLYMHNNRLTGKIPETMSNLSWLLVRLNLGGNLLTGTLPDFLGNFRQLQELLLAHNFFSGPVPKSYKNFETVDLSHNHLCGSLPETNYSASVFEGNTCLCGAPLPPCKR